MKRNAIPTMIPLEEVKRILETGERQPDRKVKSVDSKEAVKSIFLRGGGTSCYADICFEIEETTILGRGSDYANIVFPEERGGISRRHCKIRPTKDGRLQVTDLGSANGTFKADGTRLLANKAYTLKKGQSFYLAVPEECFYIM